MDWDGLIGLVRGTGHGVALAFADEPADGGAAASGTAGEAGAEAPAGEAGAGEAEPQPVTDGGSSEAIVQVPTYQHDVLTVQSNMAAGQVVIIALLAAILGMLFAQIVAHYWRV